MTQFAATVAPEQPQTLGSMIDELYERRTEIKELNERLKELKIEIEELERLILEGLQAQGLRMSRGTKATVSITENTYARVDDWDAVREYVRTHDAFHLFERRIANAAWRELYESGEQVPGITPYEERSLSVRKVR